MRHVVSVDKMEKKEDDDAPDEPPPLENDADYVMQTWLVHKLHHTYPEAGGYNDQDESVMRDWHILNIFYMRVWRGVFSDSLLPTSGASWMDGMERE